jgi:hypothetical protein
MLALFNVFIICVCCFSSSLCLRAEEAPKPWEDPYLGEIAHEIMVLRNMLVRRDIDFPLLTHLLATIRQSLIDNGYEIDESVFNRLYEEFEASEISQEIYE